MRVCQTFRCMPLHSDTRKTNALILREEVLYLHLTKPGKTRLHLGTLTVALPGSCTAFRGWRTWRRGLRTQCCKFREGNQGGKK